LENGFYPYLSTKIPLTKNDLKKIKDLGINDLQLSIDTAINKEAQIVNRVKIDNYSDKMFETLQYTDEIGLNIAVNVVTTKYNCTKSGIKLLLDKINKHNNIEKVTINPGETSLYCSEKNFIDFKNSLKEIESLENYVDEIRQNYKFSINIAGYEEIASHKKGFDEKAKNFKERSICSGNISQFCILPDGQVTICEELYWNPRFIIGNIIENSISEIWKSEKALKLYNISQDEISVHSPCKTCAEFSLCRKCQGVCWSDVLTAYGNENWDFPASNCPYAPFPYHNIYHE
jgi:radical SAM protein with 4Fe4S-binding SPASM domain